MKKVVRIITIIVIIFIIMFMYYYKKYANELNAKRNDETQKIAEVIVIDKYDKMKELYENPRREDYVEIDIIIDGNYYNNVGIRTKGAVIYNILEAFELDNYSFKVKLDYKDKEQKYNGMNEIHLNTTFYDPTGMREYLVYQMYNKMGIETHNYQFGHLYVENMDRGLITIVEVINDDYVFEKYNSENGNLYKPTPISEKESVGADLRYIDENFESYSGIFNNVKTINTTDEDKLRLINILKNINESSTTEVIEENFINFDKIIKMVAINKVLANVDVFTSFTLRNYYLYEENGKIDILTFDFDLSMNPSINTNYWTDNMYEYDLSKSSDKIYSRIVEIIIENEEYNQKYNQYVQETSQILKDMDIENVIEDIHQNTKDIINSNEKKIYTYEEYEANIEELKNFINKR